MTYIFSYYCFTCGTDTWVHKFRTSLITSEVIEVYIEKHIVMECVDFEKKNPDILVKPK